MPYVVTTLPGRSPGGRLPPRRMPLKTEGSSRRSAAVTSETCVTAPERPRSSTVFASKPGSTVRGVPVNRARVTTESPPMCASGRQASHEWRVGSIPSRSEVARAEAARASWVRTTPLGWPDDPLVATTSASPSCVGVPPAMACCSPSDDTTREGRSAPTSASRAAAGRRGSSGATASPESQTARSVSTKPAPPGRSSATSSGTGR